MAYEQEQKALEQPHKLTLDNRSRLTMTGVRDVESFDEELVVLHTSKGTLLIRGENLQLQLLSLEGGQVHVDGRVTSLTYEDDAPKGAGLLARLFG